MGFRQAIRAFLGELPPLESERFVIDDNYRSRIAQRSAPGSTHSFFEEEAQTPGDLARQFDAVRDPFPITGSGRGQRVSEEEQRFGRLFNLAVKREFIRPVWDPARTPAISYQHGAKDPQGTVLRAWQGALMRTSRTPAPDQVLRRGRPLQRTRARGRAPRVDEGPRT